MALVPRLPCRVLPPHLRLPFTTCSIRHNSTKATSSLIPIVEAPSFEEFQTNILPSGAPCLLRSCIAHWPALTRWADLSSLKDSEASAKLVPVEVARIEAGEAVAPGYNSKGTPGSSWDRVEMPLDVFLDALVREADAGDLQGARWAAYLAQYALLDEAPSLRRDVSPPLEYAKAGRGDAWPTNMWIGSAGTFTPIHKDPYHNLFSQIVGRKRVCVYPPSAAEDLYLVTDPLQRNTSLVPSPAPDAARFPRFARAQAAGWTADVAPGDVLFIPRGFFHSVQGLTASVSVNSWFL